MLRNVKKYKLKTKNGNNWNFALLVAAELVVSCSTGNVSMGTRQSTSGSEKLSFGQCNSSRNLQTISNLIATLEAENPGVKVNWVDVPWSAMETKILTAVSAKTGRREPEPWFS